MRKLIKTAMVAAIISGLGAGTAQAGLLGMAQSSGDYQVIRPDLTILGNSKNSTLINEGDKLSVDKTPVRVSLANGETMLVGEDTSIQFADKQTILIENGEMAVTVPQESDYSILIGDLELAPMKMGAESETSTVGPTVAVRRIDDQTVEVLGVSSHFSVTSRPDGNVVAVVGANDITRIVRNQLGQWNPLPRIAPSAQGGPGGPGTTEETIGEDEGESEKGVFFWFRNNVLGGASTGTAATVATVGGVALVGGGIIFTVDELNDDSDTNSREPTSPTGGR